ncbi:MAG: flagellar hook-basal body complex protein, partial [Desulfobacterales bacterium]|nr:flagellar hook-basal body complex protein [Desulfobacterales bacterium]
MGLSSALFSGISGLNTLGNSMTVVGDNIANVNTVGFKASRVTFQDVLSQTVATTAGTAQVGRGTSLADISSSFAQGSFESTDCTTDLAIGGEGFFVVCDPTTKENVYYTRAGEFRFDKEGNFTNPAGYVVRGWVLDPDTGEDIGSVTNIELKSFTSSPKATDKIKMITNLDSDASSKSVALAEVWNGADPNNEYIGENEYEYPTAVKIYDSLGSTHDVTIYYDKGSGSSYEYIVTCNPNEDNRDGIDVDQSGLGMLCKGIIAFNEASGAIEAIDFWAFEAANETTVINDPVLGTWTGEAPVKGGTYTSNTESHVYTFTATADGTVGQAGALLIDWEDEDGGSGSIDVGSGYTPGDGLPVANGLEISFAAAGAINNTETFTVTCYGDNDVRNDNSWVEKDEETVGDTSDGYFFFNSDFLGGEDTDMDVKLDFGSTYSTS